MVTVRVRGIYSTAISKILLDNGFKLVDVSDKIRERLGVDFDTTPCDVTVKDTENPDEVLVIGFPDEARRVFNLLVEKLKYVFKWESRIELHSIYLGIVVEKKGDYCLVDLGEVKGALYPCREDTGARIIVGVKQAPIKPGDRLVLTKNFRLIGKYVALTYGEPKITFSEHIHGADIKAKLSAIAAAKLMGTGLGVHFRSSSKYADKDELIRELEKLIEECRMINQTLQENLSPRKLHSGEYIGIMSLTSLAKEELDKYRRLVVSTISKHHSLKSMGLSDLVDFAEEVLPPTINGKGERTEKGVLNYLAKKLRESPRIEILHVKPTGETIKLQPGRVVDVKVDDNKLIIVLERFIKSPGIYDGLSVEKKPGDVDYLVVDSSKPVLQHNYFRDGNWIGSYVNVNTPPEISLNTIKYHDLILDVVIYPSGEVKVIDTEELREFYEEGIITRELYEYAERTAQRILLNPGDYVFNPLKNHRI
ncbi:MAG: DUF402 domain-containing protein [Desulfurococcaceae archaeon]